VTWPFLAWSFSVITIYVICYNKALYMTHFVVDMDLALATSALVPRVQYLVSEVVLAPSAAYRLESQQGLMADAEDLEDVHYHTLYGGVFDLHVMRASGAHDVVSISTAVRRRAFCAAGGGGC
jgi:hypothetical protein